MLNSVSPSLILVVEDDWITRHDISVFFEEAGWSVLQANSGEQAIGICQAGTQVDIVFSDINLGGRVTGWEVGHCFDDRSDTPIVFTSGNPDKRPAEPRTVCSFRSRI